MLQLYNTMSRKKEVFKPLEDMKVKMFTCGPSIYQRPHLGNYRTFLYEDVLQRYLEYLGYEVERALNFTDVEDKAIAEAKKEGKTLWELTDRVAKEFFEDAEVLKMKPPTHNPRSSTSVDQAVHLIRVLLEKGYAYWYGKDVFYDPLKFKGFGKLYGVDMTRWPRKKKRFWRDTYPGVHWNFGDFILWHGYRKGDDVFWETEIGRGKPAWNVQDAAMATKHLGFKIDLNCGGVDNLYRHHDYTIAVVEAVSGEKFASYWLHGEYLLLHGKKMSKSKGNVIYVDNLLKEGYRPEEIRFYLVYGHYRKKVNLTNEKLQKIRKKLGDFREMVKAIIDKQPSGSESYQKVKALIHNLARRFEEGMNDDLNVKDAFDSLFETVSKLNLLKKEGKISHDDSKAIAQELKKIDDVLQVIFS